MKRTELKRGTHRMAPGKPLARAPFRPRRQLQASTKPGLDLELEKAQQPGPRHARRKDTGPSRKIRAMVLERDSWSCVACGRDISDGQPYSIQHRVARGQGGGNDLFNLIVLCGSATSRGCHLIAESRDREMQAAGYWLESWQSPAAEGVMVHGEQGGVTVWLTPGGHYAFEPISGGSAA
jgi:hypothetical protein